MAWFAVTVAEKEIGIAGPYQTPRAAGAEATRHIMCFFSSFVTYFPAVDVKAVAKKIKEDEFKARWEVRVRGVIYRYFIRDAEMLWDVPFMGHFEEKQERLF